MRWSRRATASPGRAERRGAWGAISRPLTSIAVWGAISGLLTLIDAVTAWADHPGALRSEGWSPLTAALVFGGLALLAGMLVIVIVTLLTRRDDRAP